MIPFLLVLLHTYMDSLRTDAKEDSEERSINHHGKSIKVKASEIQDRPMNLIHRNEILELEVRSIYSIERPNNDIFKARKKYYEQLKKKEMHTQTLKLARYPENFQKALHEKLT